MRGERRGDPDQAGKVYALFPGIDTTPFGDNPPDQAPPTDQGWSATPERTIVDTDCPGTARARFEPTAGTNPPMPAKRPQRSGHWLVAIGAAALLGVAVIATTDQPAARGPHSTATPQQLAAIGSFNNAGSTVLRQSAKSELARQQVTRARRRPAQHHAHARHASRTPYAGHVVGHAPTVAPSQRADVTYSQPQTPAVSSTSSSPSSGGDSGTSTANNQTGASGPPTAFGSNGLLGPGSSPNS